MLYTLTNPNDKLAWFSHFFRQILQERICSLLEWVKLSFLEVYSELVVNISYILFTGFLAYVGVVLSYDCFELLKFSVDLLS